MPEFARTWVDLPAMGAGRILLRPSSPGIPTKELHAQLLEFTNRSCPAAPQSKRDACDCCECCNHITDDSSRSGLIADPPPAPEKDHRFSELDSAASLKDRVDAAKSLDLNSITDVDDIMALWDSLDSLRKRILFEMDSVKRARDSARNGRGAWPDNSSEAKLKELRGMLDSVLEVRQELKGQVNWPDMHKIIEPKLVPSGQATDLASALESLKIGTPSQRQDRDPKAKDCCLLQLRGWQLRAGENRLGIDLGRLIGPFLTTDFHEGAHGPLHCWVNLRDRTGRYYVLEAAQDEHGKLSISMMKDRWRGGGAEFHLDLTGVHLCDVVDELVKSGNSSPLDGKYDYNAILGPNSNTMLAKLLADAGLPVAQPSGAVGWLDWEPLLVNKSEEEWNTLEDKEKVKYQGPRRPYYRR